MVRKLVPGKSIVSVIWYEMCSLFAVFLVCLIVVIHDILVALLNDYLYFAFFDPSYQTLEDP